MAGRSGVRLAVGFLAALAAGCGTSRSLSPFQASAPASQPGVTARAADKNPPGPIDNRAASSWPSAAGRSQAGRLPVTPAPTWPSPEITRAGYGEELGSGQLTGQPVGEPVPVSRPPVTPPAYYGGGYDLDPAAATMPTTGPRGNVRQMPTVTGEMMGLAPHETPIDRAVELARRIDQVNRENLALLARIRQLEATAEARETALNETLRDVQNASDEVARTRVELQTVRKELAAVKARLLQVEKDEAETLKAIIAAIEKLLQQPMPPDANKK